MFLLSYCLIIFSTSVLEIVFGDFSLWLKVDESVANIIEHSVVAQNRHAGINRHVRLNLSLWMVAWALGTCIAHTYIYFLK